jgi:hypothetical protein
MAYAFVQKKDSGAISGTGTTIATGNMTSNPTAGNCIIAAVGYTGSDPATLTVADTLGNTYTEATAARQLVGAIGAGLRVFYALNVSGGSANSVTATYANTQSGRGIVAAEYSGIATSSAFLNANTRSQIGVGGTTDAITTNAANATSQPTLAFALGVSFAVEQQLTAGTGYTTHGTAISGGYVMTLEDKRLTATGNETATFTNPGAADDVEASIILLAEATGGGAVRRNNLTLMGCGR